MNIFYACDIKYAKAIKNVDMTYISDNLDRDYFSDKKYDVVITDNKNCIYSMYWNGYYKININPDFDNDKEMMSDFNANYDKEDLIENFYILTNDYENIDLLKSKYYVDDDRIFITYDVCNVIEMIIDGIKNNENHKS